MSQPPLFEEAQKCNSCKKEFTLMRRRHHCRNCGKSFCSGCSSKSIPLPDFNLGPERVCEGCYASISRGSSRAATAPSTTPASPSAASGKTVGMASGGSNAAGGGSALAASAVSSGPDLAARQNTTAAKKDTPKEEPKIERRAKNCKCNMPLCICPPDPSEKKEEKKDTSASTAKHHHEVAKRAASPSTSKSPPTQMSSFSGFGLTTTGRYDMKGNLNEQCRDAIKAGDFAGLQQLLNANASCNYKDNTGSTLLHLAAMFNRGDIVSLLMRAGADLSVKNSGGETPVDVAPFSLQNKMKSGVF